LVKRLLKLSPAFGGRGDYVSRIGLEFERKPKRIKGLAQRQFEG
jgi:hypothetical protein